MIELGVLVAFLGGVVSFASPCCLPMVPAYVGYMVGAAGDGPHARRASLLHGLAFTAGFSVVFVAFWASIGVVGYILADHVTLLRQLGGALLVFLGLQVAGVINVTALWRDTRPMPAFAGDGRGGGAMTSGPSYRRSLVFGTVFAAGWSPCIGPILGGIIGLASAAASVGQGTVLLAAYAAGLAVPFLAVAVGADWVGRRLTFVGRHHRGVSIATGAALVVLGVLMITGVLARLSTLATPFGV
ncbi:MAG TPA: cytochrome c biogenesis protein CcdA [Candidatus Limnocylindrales bacterium]|nr:cytochrome c biogenesis protein CcdA [Candidatus Limnocylindrales bacterium]